VTKDPPSSSERWNVDQLFQHLTRVAGWSEDGAIAEMQENFAWGQPRVHWRRTDPEGLGQEGVIPTEAFFRSKALRVARDFNSNKEHGPIDFATGEVTAGNDGRVFIQAFSKSISGTYSLTVPARLARSLWPPRLMSEAPAATNVEPIQSAALLEPQPASLEPAPTVRNPAATVPNQVSRNKHRHDDTVTPSTKKDRVISLLPDFDKQGRFKPGMKGADIERIIRPAYKEKFGADVPSRSQIWRAYQEYRKKHQPS